MPPPVSQHQHVVLIDEEWASTLIRLPMQVPNSWWNGYNKLDSASASQRATLAYQGSVASCPLAPLLPFASCLLAGCCVTSCHVPPPHVTFHRAAAARVQTMATVHCPIAIIIDVVVFCAVAIVNDVVVHRAVVIAIVNVVVRRAVAIVVNIVHHCVVIIVVAHCAVTVIVNVVLHRAIAIIVYFRSILHTQK